MVGESATANQASAGISLGELPRMHLLGRWVHKPLSHVPRFATWGIMCLYGNCRGQACDYSMSASNLIRLGGLAAMVGGVLFLAGSLVLLVGHPFLYLLGLPVRDYALSR